MHPNPDTTPSGATGPSNPSINGESPNFKPAPDTRHNVPSNQSQPELTNTPEFKLLFGGSEVVDAGGKPLVVYSGHHNLEMYGKKYDPKKATAGAFYMTESPEIASNYATGK